MIIRNTLEILKISGNRRKNNLYKKLQAALELLSSVGVTIGTTPETLHKITLRHWEKTSLLSKGPRYKLVRTKYDTLAAACRHTEDIIESFLGTEITQGEIDKIQEVLDHIVEIHKIILSNFTYFKNDFEAYTSTIGEIASNMIKYRNANKIQARDRLLMFAAKKQHLDSLGRENPSALAAVLASAIYNLSVKRMQEIERIIQVYNERHLLLFYLLEMYSETITAYHISLNKYLEGKLVFDNKIISGHMTLLAQLKLDPYYDLARTLIQNSKKAIAATSQNDKIVSLTINKTILDEIRNSCEKLRESIITFQNSDHVSDEAHHLLTYAIVLSKTLTGHQFLYRVFEQVEIALREAEAALEKGDIQKTNERVAKALKRTYW